MNTEIAIKELLNIVHSLREKYPHKRFTLDGRLVGDLGEIIAEENYKLKLFDKVIEKYDGITDDGKSIQIKATFHNSLGFPCDEKHVPEIYLGLKIYEDGSFEEIYNGPGQLIWKNVKSLKRPTNNLYNVSIKKLQDLNKQVRENSKVKMKKKRRTTAST
jgi:hypothetical protein